MVKGEHHWGSERNCWGVGGGVDLWFRKIPFPSPPFIHPTKNPFLHFRSSFFLQADWGVWNFSGGSGGGGGLDGWMKEWRREGGENCGFGKYYSPPHLSFLLHDQEPLSSFLFPKRLRYFSTVGIVGGGEYHGNMNGTP